MNAISKECTHEHIIYKRIDDTHVVKSNYNENGKKTKEKTIFVREVFQYGKSHENTDDFFKGMIARCGYHEITN